MCRNSRVRLSLGPALVLGLLIVPVLHAQEGHLILGAGINLSGGFDNNPNLRGVGQIPSSGSSSSFYGVSPTLTLTSTGEKPSLTASYALGSQYTNTGSNTTRPSHTATLSFNRSLTPRWTIGVSESFELTSDATSFRALRGAPAVPSAAEDLGFLFDPAAARVMARSNRTNISVGYTFDEHSTISIGASHSLRTYGDAGAFRGVLSNQQTVSEQITYNRRTSRNESWTFGYSGNFSFFDQFDNTQTHSGSVGYSNLLASNLTMQISVGSSYVKSQQSGDGYIGYNASAALQKSVRQNSFSLSYSQQSGQSSGLGSVSDSRSATITAARTTRTLTMSGSSSVFDTAGTLDNTQRMRGISATGAVGVPINRKLTFQAGVSYQRYLQTAIFGFDQKRLFLALSYSEPRLWRIR